MGRFRSREVEVNLAIGEEIRIADAPSSEPVKNLTVRVLPWRKGGTIGGTAGSIAWNVFYGGGHDQPAKVAAKSSGTTSATNAFDLIDGAADFNADGVVPGDRVMNTTDGTEAVIVSVDAGGTFVTLDADVIPTGKAYIITTNVVKYNMGITQASGTLAAATNLLPKTLHTDAGLLSEDRVLVPSMMNVRIDPGAARAIHLTNNLDTGDFNCRVVFISETISEVN